MERAADTERDQPVPPNETTMFVGTNRASRPQAGYVRGRYNLRPVDAETTDTQPQAASDIVIRHVMNLARAERPEPRRKKVA